MRAIILLLQDMLEYAIERRDTAQDRLTFLYWDKAQEHYKKLLEKEYAERAVKT